MIIVANTLISIALVTILISRRAVKKMKPPVIYKNNNDTRNARYAVNKNGCLEEISGNKISGQYIDEA
jgi:hypothetical protein